MGEFYACDGCGTLRTDDEECYVCGEKDRFTPMKHVEDAGEFEEADGYECDECGETFSAESSLHSHMASHSK